MKRVFGKEGQGVRLWMLVFRLSRPSFFWGSCVLFGAQGFRCGRNNPCGRPLWDEEIPTTTYQNLVLLRTFSDRQKRKSLRYKYLFLTRSHKATEFGRLLVIPLLRVFVSLCESIFGCGRRPRWVPPWN